jgi:hypothetical protein
LFPGIAAENIKDPLDPQFMARNAALFPTAIVSLEDPHFIKFKAAISALPQEVGLAAAIKFLFLAEEGGGNPVFVGIPSSKVEVDPKLNDQVLQRFYSLLGANPFMAEMWRSFCRSATSGVTPPDLVPSAWNRSEDLPLHFQLGASNRLAQAVMRYRKLALSDNQKATMLCKDYRLAVGELLAAGKLAAIQCDGQPVAQRIVASSLLLGVLVTSPQLWGTDNLDSCRILFAAQKFAAASVSFAEAIKAASATPGGVQAKMLGKVQALDEELQRLVVSAVDYLSNSTLKTPEERADISLVLGAWSDSTAIAIEQVAGLLWSSAVPNGIFDSVTTKASELAPFLASPVSVDPMKRKDTLIRRVVETSKGLGGLKAVGGIAEAKKGALLLAVTHQGVFERPGVFEMLALGGAAGQGKIANLPVFEQNFKRLLSPEYLTLLNDDEFERLGKSLDQQRQAYAWLSSEGVALIANRQFQVAKSILTGLLSPALTGDVTEPGLSIFNKAAATTAPVGADGKPTGAAAPLQENFNRLFSPGADLNELLVELEALSAAGYRIMQELRDGSSAYQSFRSQVLSPAPDQGGLIGSYEVVLAAKRIMEDPENAVLLANDSLRIIRDRVDAINQAGFKLARDPENCAEVPVLSELKRLFDSQRPRAEAGKEK